ncbi:MAG: T9SS type A sorting domain-containing protein [Ignavibacteria bacterium]|nr:T9SS type A sorting domain-containing protein [Ignavibacteria bacterium]
MKFLSKLLISALVMVSCTVGLYAQAPSGPMSGSYSVGTGSSNFMNTLSAAFAFVNLYGLNGNVTLNIISDINETAGTPPTLNQWTNGQYSLTIQPSGGTWTIEGSYNDGLILLNGADKVTINGGSGKGLILKNNYSAGAAAVVRLKSLGTDLGCDNVTITNCKIYGGSASTAGCYGIYAFDNTAITNTPTPSPTAGSGNNNLTITNNEFFKSRHGVLVMGSTTSSLTNVNISGNTFGSITPAEYIGTKAIWVENVNAPNITGNTIFNMKANVASVVDGVIGIHINGYTYDGTIARNKIYGLSSTVANTGVYGINVMSGGTNMTIANNMISAITSANNSTSSTQFNPYGIRIDGGNNHKIINNTINMTGTQSGAGSSGSLTSALMVTQVVPFLNICTGLDVRNNIFMNSITGSAGTKSYAIYVPDKDAFAECDYNDYYVSGTYGKLGYIGTTEVTSLAALKTATEKDANSITSNVTFLNASSGDLHLEGASLSNMDLLCPAITPAVAKDFDNVDRKTATSTQMGADEAIPNLSVTAPLVANPFLTSYCSGSTAQITLNFTGAILNYPDGIARSNPPLIYEWYHDNVIIPGANASSYLITPLTAEDAGNYHGTIRVLDYSVPTNVVTLNITQPTAIAKQPNSISLGCSGSPFTLTVTTIGTVSSFQWERLNTTNSTWENVPGQVTNTLNIPSVSSSDLGYYRLKVRGFNNNCDPDSIYSNITDLQYAEPVVMGVPDLSYNFKPAIGVCRDDMVIISVNLTGTVESYQWQIDANFSGTFVDIPGANSQEFVIDAVSDVDKGDYRCVVTSYCGGVSFTTSVVGFNKVWDSHVTFTTNPKPYVICEGEDVLLSVNAIGIVHNYQWYKDGIMISKSDNSTSDSLIFKIKNATFHASGVYTCRVLADDCDGINTPRESEPALVYVNRATNIIYPPKNQVLAPGSKAVFEVFAHISYPASVQWYKGTTLLQNNSWVEGAQSSLMTITDLTGEDYGTDYWVVVTGLCGADTATNFGILEPDLEFLSHPSDITLCKGELISFTAVAENSSSAEEPQYQWYFNDTPLTEGGRVSGSRTTTLLIEDANEADEGEYRLSATLESIDFTIYSNAGSVTVNLPPVITVQPEPVIEAEETKEFEMTVEVESALPVTYAWYKIDITNELVGEEATYSKEEAEAEDAGAYYCEISNNCGVVYSDTVNLSVTKYSQTSVNEAVAGEFALLNAEPNPVFDNATIRFNSSTTKQVKLTLLDVYGREIATLFDEMVQPGSYNVKFSANQFNLGSGVYYYTLNAGSFTQTKSIIIVK